MRSFTRGFVGSTRRRVFAAFGCAAVLITGSLSATAQAEAQSSVPSPAQAADIFLTLMGEPGPHRVPGHYFTSPVPPKAQNDIRPTALVGPSTPILVGDSLCTIAVSGFDAHGNKVAITAGHCANPGTPVTSGDAPEAGRIGTYVRTGSPDYGVIKLNNNVRLTNTYGRASIGQLGGAVPATLQQICKTGISTGTSCGPVIGVDGPYLLAHLCGSHGDSGGPIYAGNRLVAIVNGGLGNLPSCTTPLQGPVHAPVAGALWTVIQRSLDANGGVGAGFRLP